MDIFKVGLFVGTSPTHTQTHMYEYNLTYLMYMHMYKLSALSNYSNGLRYSLSLFCPPHKQYRVRHNNFAAQNLFYLTHTTIMDGGGRVAGEKGHLVVCPGSTFQPNRLYEQILIRNRPLTRSLMDLVSHTQAPMSAHQRRSCKLVVLSPTLFTDHMLIT